MLGVSAPGLLCGSIPPLNLRQTCRQHRAPTAAASVSTAGERSRHSHFEREHLTSSNLLSSNGDSSPS